MLGSITPLGERGRNRRWGVTVTAYVLGSTLGGAAIGAALGGLGSLPPGGNVTARLWLLALVTATGLVLDTGVGGLRLPTVHRQVNQDWIGTYRGWVVGLGFGVQLGVGVATIVTTSTVYATMVAAFLSGSAATGALIAGTFGLVRAGVVLAVARVDRPDRLGGVDTWLRRWDGRARRVTLAAGGALGAALVAGAMRWPS